jgi:hypothetical protein
LEGQEQLGHVTVPYVTPIHLIKERIESQIGKRLVENIIDVEKLEAEGVDAI